MRRAWSPTCESPISPSISARHGVDNHHVHGVAPDEHFGNLQGLFAGIGLGDQEVVHVHTQPPGVLDIQSMLRVHECRDPPAPLCVGDDVETKRRLPAGFRAIDL